MESLGQKLREAREQQNHTMEQVARDTHISKSHLHALEEENFSLIPGETYVIGFLRNYAEYLSLNAEELITLYKNMKIQEQPLPMNELLEGQHRKPLARRLLLIFAVLGILGGGGFLLYHYVLAGRGESTVDSKPVKRLQSNAAEYMFQGEVLSRWFVLEDTIRVPLNGQSYSLKLVAIADKLTLRIPGGTLELNIGEERPLDLNGDSRADLRLLLNDLDSGGLEQRANLGLYKVIRGLPPGEASIAATSGGAEPETGAAVPAGSEAGAVPPATVASTGPETAAVTPAVSSAEAEVAPTTPGGVSSTEAEVTRTTPGGVSSTEAAAGRTTPTASEVPLSSGSPLRTAEGPEQFRVSINFRGYCLFRYRLSDSEREERFFHKGENFSLDVRQAVTLWVSNAGALRVMIGGRDVGMGKPGQVATKQIRWAEQEGTGVYALEVVSLD